MIVESLETRVALKKPISTDEVQGAADLMESLGFSEQSAYYARLERLYVLADKQKPAVVEKPAERPDAPVTDSEALDFKRVGRREYAAIYSRGSAFLKFVYDHFFLMKLHKRWYKDRGMAVKISHRFNQEGRIDLVDAVLVHSLDPRMDRAVKHLLSVDGYDKKEKGWHGAEAFYLPIVPFEMIAFDEQFINKTYVERCQSLLREGHDGARLLVREMRAGKLQESSSVRSEQKQLAEIVEDREGLYMLIKAASLVPTVRDYDKERVMVGYTASDPLAG